MNRRGFFAAMMAPFVVPFTQPEGYFGPTYHWPPDDFYTGHYLVVGDQVRQITGYNANTKTIALQVKANVLMNQMADV